MWPFRRQPSLEQLTEPTVREIDAIVTSPDQIQSPLSGLRGAALSFELLERVPCVPAVGSTLSAMLTPTLHHMASKPSEAYRHISRLVFGSSITVAIGALEVEVPLGRAVLQLVMSTPTAERVPDVVPGLLAERVTQARATCTEGPLCYRERTLTNGSKVRVRAVFETVLQPTSNGYRSAAERRTIVRPDLGAILVTEVLDAPEW